MKVYTVYDKESETCMNPIAYDTDRDAKEGFQMVANDASSTIGKFPNDFKLVRIGEFDKRTGLLKALEEHETICWAKDVIIQPGPELAQ